MRIEFSTLASSCQKFIFFIARCENYITSFYFNTFLFAVVSIILMRDRIGGYFRGGDGDYYRRSIEVNLNFSNAPFENMALDPFQGMGEIADPLNILLSPALMSRALIEDHVMRVGVPYFILGLLTYISIYALGRSANLNKMEAVVAAWIGSLLAVPLTQWSAVLPIYAIPHLQVFAIGNLATATFFALGKKVEISPNIIYGVLFVTLSLLTLLFAPDYAAIGGLSFALICLGAILGHGGKPELLWKIIMVLVIATILLALRIDQYLLGLTAFSSRFFFNYNVDSLVDYTQLSSIFSMNLLGLFSVLSFIISIFLINSNRYDYKSISFSMLLAYSIVSIYSLSLIYFGKWFTINAYQIEFYIIGVYALLTALAICRLLPDGIGMLLSYISERQYHPGNLRLATFVLFGVMTAFLLRSPLSSIVTRAVAKPWTVHSTAITDFLILNIAIGSSHLWRGSVASFLPPLDQTTQHSDNESVQGLAQEFYGNAHENYFLRHFNIPTLESNNHYLTPLLDIFTRRLLRHANSKAIVSFAYVNRLRPRLLSAMGVRYVIDDDFHDETSLKLVKYITSASGMKNLYLYELSNVNTGNYSPTEVIYKKTSDEIIEELDREDFDFMKSAVLIDSTISGNLVPAIKSDLHVEKSGFRVTAQSRGNSMIILPVQYSSCLVWVPVADNGVKVKIVQANLIHTALLFDIDIDGYLIYKFGPLSSSDCRRKDAENLRTLMGGGS